MQFMQVTTNFISDLLLICSGSVLDFCFFLALAGVFKALHLPFSRLTWLLGTAVLIISWGYCIKVFMQPQYSSDDRMLELGMVLLGLASCLVVVFSFSQWPTRGWYVFIKRRTSTLIIKPSRQVFLFLRQQHLFLGWIVLATATAHGVFFLPRLRNSPDSIFGAAILTGVVAWAVLIILTLPGLLLTRAAKRKHSRKFTYSLHLMLAIVFFIALAFHFAFVL